MPNICNNIALKGKQMCQSLYEYINAENLRHVRRLQVAIENQEKIAAYEDTAKALGLEVVVRPSDFSNDCNVWLFGDLFHIANKTLDTRYAAGDMYLIGDIQAQQKHIV